MSKYLDDNVETAIVDGLFELGLNGREADIYLALIKLGEVGTSKICLLTGLHRQYVYQYLDSLENKGLVQHIVIRGRKRFSAKSPEVLTKLLDQKMIVAERVRSDIQKIAKVPEEQIVEVNQGEDSYKISAFKLLNQTARGTEILVIGGVGDRFVKILDKQLEKYEKNRLEKQISIRYIGSEKQRVTLETSTRKLFTYKLLPGDFSDITYTVIWPTFVSLDTFGVPVTQTVIHNPAISAGYKEFYETLWNMGK